MPKIVELRQDRAFLRSNFDGYKLSLDSVPIIRQNHQTAEPRNNRPSDDQYSLLHVEMFSVQNLLVADPWARNTCYYVNLRDELIRCNYDETTGRPETPQVVFSVKSRDDYIKGDYNYSMRFISEKYCVLCNGKRKILLLETGDRRKANEWKQVAEAIISANEDELNFMLYDSRLDIIQEQKRISLALGRVQHEESMKNGESAGGGSSGSSYFMRLYWAHWIQKDANSWEYAIVETLESKGSIFYCAFEPRAESLVISSNRDFRFKSESTNEAIEVAPEPEEKPQLHGDTVDTYDYAWTQTNDDIVVEFPVKSGKTNADYNVNCTKDSLTVKCGDEILLEQSLYATIDNDLTTWAIENHILEVTLFKEPSLPWPALLANGIGPKERKIENGINNLPADQQPIANLEAPIEDCDFPMGSMEYDVKIDRFNLSSKEVTHIVLLGNTPPLFSTNLRAGFPSAIATRQDVDACLWLQQYNPSKPDEWSLRHEGNLHAFGYVQASKTQKKFMDCAPDLSYAVISEAFRHVFLYKMNYDTANGLRNRNGPQVQLGKQHLITLEDAGEVLGLATASSVIVLLTEKCLLFLQMS